MLFCRLQRLAWAVAPHMNATLFHLRAIRIHMVSLFFEEEPEVTKVAVTACFARWYMAGQEAIHRI
uniref:Uncharacterized protein n=1 Tax=Myoviridae sp. ct3D84 TaxID=2825023 RepID=A0A8S5PAM2_9CAUD|nr:MAG TPA: hypothetical protein [Myoviridae sp. ct3D84]